jgi:hypothetical protein
MKVVTLLTPSHRRFLDQWFLPSFPFNPNLELHIKFREQKCKTAEFESEGWWDTMRDKAVCFMEELATCKEGEQFIFSDPDIQFFGDFYEDLLKESEGQDVVFQNDFGGGCNTGFFIARNTEPTRYLFRAMVQYLKHFSNEQKAATEFCFNQKKYYELKDLKWKLLPTKYWTYGEFRKTWNGTDDFQIPKDILLHHANWTDKFHLKSEMLNLVKDKHVHQSTNI